MEYPTGYPMGEKWVEIVWNGLEIIWNGLEIV